MAEVSTHLCSGMLCCHDASHAATLEGCPRLIQPVREELGIGKVAGELVEAALGSEGGFKTTAGASSVALRADRPRRAQNVPTSGENGPRSHAAEHPPSGREAAI
jgi:hypothetical protein